MVSGWDAVVAMDENRVSGLRELVSCASEWLVGMTLVDLRKASVTPEEIEMPWEVTFGVAMDVSIILSEI